MRSVLVRYKVKSAEAAAENERLIRQVFEQLVRDKPAGMRYQAFKLSDGMSFAHVASHDAADGNPLVKSEAFKAFVAGIKERCAEQPVQTEMTMVGAYDALDPGSNPG
jgi:hypothetical protein